MMIDLQRNEKKNEHINICDKIFVSTATQIIQKNIQYKYLVKYYVVLSIYLFRFGFSAGKSKKAIENNKTEAAMSELVVVML